jgi:hypothetical protein
MADGDDTREPKPPNPDDSKSKCDDAIAQPAEDAQPDDGSIPPRNDYAGLYETHIGRLIATARDDFGVDEQSAIELAHDVMTTFIHVSSRVSNVPGWLTGAISFASEAYVLRGVVVDSTRESKAPPDLTLPNGVRWRDVAGRLTPRFRRVMELRYVDGRAVAEIAEMLGTTQRYVEALLERCLEQTEKFASRPEEP